MAEDVKAKLMDMDKVDSMIASCAVSLWNADQYRLFGIGGRNATSSGTLADESESERKYWYGKAQRQLWK